MQQIEFIRATANTSFAYNATPGSIPACSISVSPALINRRVWADVRQPAGARDVEFLVDFLQGGVSVGSIPHRISDAPESWATTSMLFALGGSHYNQPAMHRMAPNALMAATTEVLGSGDSNRAIMPIELVAQCDEIRLTIQQWSASGGATTNGRIFLFCLSTIHPPY